MKPASKVLEIFGRVTIAGARLDLQTAPWRHPGRGEARLAGTHPNYRRPVNLGVIEDIQPLSILAPFHHLGGSDGD